MHLEINESALAELVSGLSCEQQREFFATMKAIIGLPLNLLETHSAENLAQRFADSGDTETAHWLQERLDSSMNLVK